MFGEKEEEEEDEVGLEAIRICFILFLPVVAAATPNAACASLRPPRSKELKRVQHCVRPSVRVYVVCKKGGGGGGKGGRAAERREVQVDERDVGRREEQHMYVNACVNGPVSLGWREGRLD